MSLGRSVECTRLYDICLYFLFTVRVPSRGMDAILGLFKKASDRLGIQWAPLNVPTSRRLQTLGAGSWIFIVLFGEFIAIYYYIKLLYSQYWWLAILYGVWMLYDSEICRRGGRSYGWIRSSALWKNYCEYFPIKLVKTAQLDPSRNYIFACFPHGILPLGAYGALCSNGLDFENVFPGMTCSMITLTGHFLVPFFRDFILGMGMCSSASDSILYLLDSKKNKGKCVALSVGGAAEALESKPREYKIILSRRKGFIRIAMKAGAPIVPVFTFGEIDLYRNPSNPSTSLVRRFQDTVRKWTGISPIFPVGRGMFQYSYGVLPLRNPLTTVVGSPMEVPKNADPTDEEVDAVHAEFKQRLIDLFENEKKKYLKYHEDAQLIIT